MYKILISPGHFDVYNPFYIRRTMLTNEAAQNLIWSMSLYNKLKNRDDIKVYMTRWDDHAEVTMPDKAEMSKGYDLYLAPHSDAGGGQGSTMYCDTDPAYNDIPLATAIIEAHCKATNTRNNGLRWVAEGWNSLGRPIAGYSNYYYEIAHAYCIALIFERFFHDYSLDVEKNVDSDDIERSTTAVANVFIKMKGNGKLIGQTSTPITTEKPVTNVPATTGVDISDHALKEVGNKGSKYVQEFYGPTRKDQWGNDWCVIFDYAMAKKAGLSMPYVDDCNSFIEEAVKKGLYYSNDTRRFKGKVLEFVQENDLVFYDYNDNGWADHTGICYFADNNNFKTVEGNTGSDVATESKVNLFSYSQDEPTLLGVIRGLPKATAPVTQPQPKPLPNVKEIEVKSAVNGYHSVENLIRKFDPVVYEKGKYFIYREFGEYINITKNPIAPGAWVDLKDTSGYSIQLGFYKNMDNARAKVRELKEKGIDAIIKTVQPK